LTENSGSSVKPVRDETIRVTLGRPEPLPTSPRPVVPSIDLSSTSTPRSWKSTVAQSDPDRDQNAAAGVSPRRYQGSRDQPATKAAARQAPRPNSADPAALLSQAEAKLEALNTYQVRISRIERVGGQLLPEEEILLSIRRHPKAVRLEWPSGANKGRE